MIKNTFVLLFLLTSITGCVDNEQDEMPLDDPYPFRLMVDAEEGGDLTDAEDYALEVAFADHTGTLPLQTMTLDYVISKIEGSMAGVVKIDKIVYEAEIDDCIYEREVVFTSSDDNLSGTITIPVDADLKTVPEAFEVIFALPGEDGMAGSFTFELQNLQGPGMVILGAPVKFAYETLNNDVAGEWELMLNDATQFEQFKSVFAPLNSDLKDLDFDDITGKVKAEFEFEEMKFIVELKDMEEITTCKDGESETEIINKEIEIEAAYEAGEGELLLEGSHFITGDDGETEDALDFIVESTYAINEADEEIEITFLKVIDEDNFAEGEELFRNDDEVVLTFKKD